MVDYLSNEILGSVEQTEKEFLLKTSILSYFNSSICAALLDIPEVRAENIIDRLVEKNLFIVALDPQEEVYRYHQVFGEFLQLPLHKHDPEINIAFHAKAAEIYESRGDLEESIKHLFQVGDYSRALKVIEKMGQNLKGWTYLKQIPLKHVAENRELAIQRVFVHFCSMELNRCTELINYMEENIQDKSTLRILKLALSLIEDADLVGEIENSWLEDLKAMEISPVTRAIIYLHISLLLGIQDRYKQALNLLEQAEAIERKFNNPYINYYVLNMKSQIKESLGDLNDCLYLYDEITQLQKSNPILSPLAGNSLIGAAGIYLKRMQLKEAENCLSRARKLMDRSYTSLDRGYVFNMMELKVLMGEHQEALQLIQDLMNFEIYKNPLYFSAVLKYLMYMGQASKDMLQEYLEVYTTFQKNHSLRHEDSLVYSRSLLLLGKGRQALQQVEDILETARREGIKTTLLEALLLRVLILKDQKEESQKNILNLLREAVHYSYENQFLSPFVMEGNELKQDLKLLLEQRGKDLNLQEKKFTPAS
ncbi:MalT transcriptional regulator family protein [Candidatus Contubernalis alkaliaceticus]|uniref:hypothetical protein n=1 Tax=Candidatus Contubernalis alkaliaceticus TaxID=338645 RepID=UPI001F4BF757|nr:hypothetical protein [Candidatus Contubernalis alkalaceticus]UNC91190.1 hypothetical protein HUE98_03260 [Candidatus Contubernalis alkalaceticus]